MATNKIQHSSCMHLILLFCVHTFSKVYIISNIDSEHYSLLTQYISPTLSTSEKCKRCSLLTRYTNIFPHHQTNFWQVHTHTGTKTIQTLPTTCLTTVLAFPTNIIHLCHADCFELTASIVYGLIKQWSFVQEYSFITLQIDDIFVHISLRCACACSVSTSKLMFTQSVISL